MMYLVFVLAKELDYVSHCIFLRSDTLFFQYVDVSWANSRMNNNITVSYTVLCYIVQSKKRCPFDGGRDRIIIELSKSLITVIVLTQISFSAAPSVAIDSLFYSEATGWPIGHLTRKR